tara:strand:+ start:9804 stop:9947 length:144 start_codon:yes stop_codon:yes gene_type:complete
MDLDSPQRSARAHCMRQAGKDAAEIPEWKWVHPGGHLVFLGAWLDFL